MQIFRCGRIEIDHLRSRDKKPVSAINEIGRIEHRVIPDISTALVASLASQQVSAKAAGTDGGDV